MPTHKHTTHFDFEDVYHPDLSCRALHRVGIVPHMKTELTAHTKSHFFPVKSLMVGHEGASGVHYIAKSI